jgi:hypothetical protein
MICSLITVCLLTINKFYNDSFHLNSYLADLLELPVEVMNKMEKEFLFTLDFSVNVDAQEYA